MIIVTFFFIAVLVGWVLILKDALTGFRQGYALALLVVIAGATYAFGVPHFIW